jgi:hypothetical protein
MHRQIFISYSRADYEFTKKLVDALTQFGINTWLDQRDIPAGQPWDTSIQKALQESDGFLVILSPTSVASKNVMDELSYAINSNKKIYPVLIKECEMPYRLARLQYIDFTGQFSRGFNRLVENIKQERPHAPTPLKTPKVQPTTAQKPEKTTGGAQKYLKYFLIAAFGCFLISAMGVLAYFTFRNFFPPAPTATREISSGGNTQAVIHTDTPLVAAAPSNTARATDTQPPPKTQAPTHTQAPTNTSTPTKTNTPTKTSTPTNTRTPEPQLIALQSLQSGQYVRAGVGSQSYLAAASTQIAGWETFQLIYLGGDQVAIKSVQSGKYVRAGVGSESYLAATSSQVASWETFQLIFLGGDQIALKSVQSGKYVRAGVGSQSYLAAASSQVAGWETFIIIYLE